MASNFPFLAIIFLVSLALFPNLSSAQNSNQDFLDAHNSVRAQVGVPPMTWDETLANYSREAANENRDRCPSFIGRRNPYGYGQSHSVGQGEFTARQAVEEWVAEKNNYNQNSNTCSNGLNCRRYTQVVWRDSVTLGCARIRCASSNPWYIVFCTYNPSGNIFGQRPY